MIACDNPLAILARTITLLGNELSPRIKKATLIAIGKHHLINKYQVIETNFTDEEYHQVM